MLHKAIEMDGFHDMIEAGKQETEVRCHERDSLQAQVRKLEQLLTEVQEGRERELAKQVESM